MDTCVRPMELKDTVDMMLSDDYKERFKAEYYQTEIRYSKLINMLNLLDEAGPGNEDVLGFKPGVSKWAFECQARAMEEYLDLLKERAEIEKIEISH